jgi:son of sevenless-like protein
MKSYLQDEDIHVAEEAKEFFISSKLQDMESAKQNVLNAINKRLELFAKVSTSKRKSYITQPTPPVLFTANNQSLSLLEIDPLEIARQITLFESKFFSKLKPTEFLNTNWQKDPASAPNVKRMIFNSNKITGWIATYVLAEPSARKRAAFLEHFIKIAKVFEFKIVLGRNA